MILVTGGAGYVGSLLVPELLALGERVRVVDTLWFGNSLPEHPNLEVIKGDLRLCDPTGWKTSMPSFIFRAYRTIQQPTLPSP